MYNTQKQKEKKTEKKEKVKNTTTHRRQTLKRPICPLFDLKIEEKKFKTTP